MMAAYGSGAVARSKETGKTIMNIDIGGGTSKIAIVKSGIIVDTTSLFVGSRVVAMDASGEVMRIEESAALAAKELGFELKLGAALSTEHQAAIVEILSQALFELVEGKRLSPFSQRLMESPPLTYPGAIDAMMFSGGVAEYIYGYEKSDFGDLGPLLGKKIIAHMAAPTSGALVQEPAERIRATVMGAALYSLQVSGNTIFISNRTTLPMRNLLVSKVVIEDENPTAAAVADSVRRSLSRYDIDRHQPSDPVALAIGLPAHTTPNPVLLRSLSQGIISALDHTFPGAQSVVLIFDIDIANLMGHSLAEKLGGSKDILCIDGIGVSDLDYVDIGTPIESSQTLPVVLKNLVFAKSAAR